jgi:hypothetical protein
MLTSLFANSKKPAEMLIWKSFSLSAERAAMAERRRGMT